jgi:hypothetical protein
VLNFQFLSRSRFLTDETWHRFVAHEIEELEFGGDCCSCRNQLGCQTVTVVGNQAKVGILIPPGHITLFEQQSSVTVLEIPASSKSSTVDQEYLAFLLGSSQRWKNTY